jgi:hypothetical protein
VLATECNHQWDYREYCGAHVCGLCEAHAHVDREGVVYQTLARCYCGWAASGGNGYQELLDEGETIEPDEPDG